MDPIENDAAGMAPDGELVIYYEGRPIARVLAYAPRSGKRRELGVLAGKGWIADDFDAPLPDAVLADFEGRD